MKLPRCFALLGLSWFGVIATAATALAQTAPVITAQPLSRTVHSGAAVSFRVTATGTPAPTYQWRKNNVAIAGATAAILSLDGAVAGDAGAYTVLVANAAGSVTSNAATLTVNDTILAIVSGPSGVTAGQTATFSTAPSGGTPPYTYQWFKNGAAIPGATGASYTTPPTNFADDNNSTYFVRITDFLSVVTTTSDKVLFVNPALQSITFNAPVNPVVSPTPVTLTATASSGLPITYSIVAGAGTISGASITFTAAGSITVRAAQPGDANFSPALLDRTFTIGKGTPVVTWPAPAPVADGTALGATQLNATANVPGTFVYNPPSGTVVHKPSQTLSLTFTPSNTTNYNLVTATRSLGVVSVDGPVGVTAGQTATFSVSGTAGTPPFTYQWYKNAVTPANLIAGATRDSYTTPPTTVTGDNNSTYLVTIRDNLGIVTTFSSAPLFVDKGDQTITFPAPTNPVVSPTPLALSATASSGLPVAYSVLAGPATVSANAVTLTGVGTVTLRAAQAGSANFNAAANVDRSFTVGRGTPVITWAAPSAVTDGTALSGTQLNATANVPGTFAYNPPPGTVVHSPAQTLNVTFTPANAVNYTTATAQRSLTVGAVQEFARLSNVAVRANLAASQTLIVGFTMQGGAKPIVIRAVGPGLTPLGVDGVMSDPRMAVFKDALQIDANDNWGGGGTLRDAFAAVGAFPIPAGSLDAAVLRSVEGGHTAQITGGSGIVLVEVYDAGTGSTPRLTNISARNRVGTGGDILIAGFTVSGQGERALLIRAVGPTLTRLGVPGVLVDPQLALFSGQNKMMENDTWDPALAATFGSVGAFPLNAGSRDAAVVVRLGAGSYTVQVSGADGGTGEGLVELYELP